MKLTKDERNGKKGYQPWPPPPLIAETPKDRLYEGRLKRSLRKKHYCCRKASLTCLSKKYIR